MSEQAVTADNEFFNRAQKNGSLSITSATTAQRIPGWPETTLMNAPEPERRAYVVGFPGECRVTVTQGRDDPDEAMAIPTDSWPNRITELGVTQVYIDDHGMLRTEPDLTSDIEKLVHHGMQVMVTIDDAIDEFDLVARLSHLGPRLLTRRGTLPDGAWNMLQTQTDHALDVHRAVIETVCECHPILAQLFLTALYRTGEGGPFPASAVIEALAEAVAHVVRTQFAQPRDQAAFLLCLALHANPMSTQRGCQHLGSTGPRSIRRMAQILSSEPVPPELSTTLWQQLRTHLGAEVFDGARSALLTLLSDGLPGDVDHRELLELLELLTSDRKPSLNREIANLVRRTADAAGAGGRKCIVQCLPELVEDSSAGEAAARLAAACADTDLGVLGVSLAEINAVGTTPDAVCTAMSPCLRWSILF